MPVIFGHEYQLYLVWTEEIRIDVSEIENLDSFISYI